MGGETLSHMILTPFLFVLLELDQKKLQAEAKKQESENATFRPQTNAGKIMRDNMAHFSVGKGEEGMRKYLMRQEQARELKAEK